MNTDILQDDNDQYLIDERGNTLVGNVAGPWVRQYFPHQLNPAVVRGVYADLLGAGAPGDEAAAAKAETLLEDEIAKIVLQQKQHQRFKPDVGHRPWPGRGLLAAGVPGGQPGAWAAGGS